MTNPCFAIGIDVGGTKTAAGLVEFPCAKVHSTHTIPTHPERGGEPLLNDVLELARRLKTEALDHGWVVHGIGLGLCEIVETNGTIASASSIQWKRLPIAQSLSVIAPAVIEADVRAAALAESLFGAGKGSSCFLYVTVGTGISCCLVLGGKPFTGARGATGTMASSPLPNPWQPHSTAAVHTLEEIASGPALVARYNQAAAKRALTSFEVIEAAAAGNPLAVDVVSIAGRTLGATVALLANTLDPDRIVIGGGLGLSGGLYWTSFIESTRRHLWHEPHQHLPILPAATGLSAGIIGAAATAWQNRSR